MPLQDNRYALHYNPVKILGFVPILEIPTCATVLEISLVKTAHPVSTVIHISATRKISIRGWRRRGVWDEGLLFVIEITGMPCPKGVPFNEREGQKVICSGTEKAIESSQKDITIQLFYSIKCWSKLL